MGREINNFLYNDLYQTAIKPNEKQLYFISCGKKWCDFPKVIEHLKKADLFDYSLLCTSNLEIETWLIVQKYKISFFFQTQTRQKNTNAIVDKKKKLVWTGHCIF